MLFFSSPVMLLSITLVFIMSGTPIFYLQKRAGKNKKPFKIIKFRTMYPGAENDQKLYKYLNQAPEPMFKIKNDPRFTKVGKWLSKTGLDELPQLFNVIRGEMSLVGPRPLPIREADQLTKDWDFRFLVNPGIFSQWTLDDSRHESLEIWKVLENETLLFSRKISNDFILVYLNVCQQLKKTAVILLRLIT